MLADNVIARYPIDNATVANEIAPVLGVFMGCEYFSTNTATNNLIKSAYWPAATQVMPGTYIKAFVIDDPDMVWNIQVSTATNVADDARFGGTTNQAAILAYMGQNFAFGLGGGGANLSPNNPTAGSTRSDAFFRPPPSSTRIFPRFSVFIFVRKPVFLATHWV